jgi:hypothetical protein
VLKRELRDGLGSETPSGQPASPIK